VNDKKMTKKKLLYFVNLRLHGFHGREVMDLCCRVI